MFIMLRLSVRLSVCPAEPVTEEWGSRKVQIYTQFHSGMCHTEYKSSKVKVRRPDLA